MKTTYWILGGVLAAAAVLWPGDGDKARAADLGGSCCADLEERVAELEATVARKGNRKVRLTISGEISKAVLWTDGLDGLSANHAARVIDNGNSGSKIRLVGEAKVANDITAGMIFEYGFDETRGLGLPAPVGSVVHWLDGDAELRRSAVWVKTSLGKVTIGKFNLATDEITEIDTSESHLAARMMSIQPLWSYVGLGGLPLVGGNLLNPTPFHDLRAQVLRYDSPDLAGFTASASWAGGSTLTGDDAWDVALRFAKEVAGFRVAAGAGYRVEQHSTGLSLPDQKTLSGSASVMHLVSGMFLTAAAADQKDNPVFGDIRMWHVKAGWQKNVFGPGATTLFGEYADHKLSNVFGVPGFDVDSTFWGVGVMQAIDAASLDLFLSARQYKSDALSGDATTVLGGARIKF